MVKKTNKEKMGEFVKEKDGTIYFRDVWGESWSAEVLDDLIKTLRKQREARESIEYYESMALKYPDE